jgi:hypothetical protein
MLGAGLAEWTSIVRRQQHAPLKDLRVPLPRSETSPGRVGVFGETSGWQLDSTGFDWPAWLLLRP